MIRQSEPIEFVSNCPICDKSQTFKSENDFLSARDHLRADDCPYSSKVRGLTSCVTRDRAVAATLFSLWSKDRLKTLRIHEAAPLKRGLTLWLEQNADSYLQSGYFPSAPFGTIVNGLRNEDLEDQTIQDNSLDLVLHLDVLEHLFDPFKALSEIFRTLIPGGVCLFTTPTYGNRSWSEQVAFREARGIRFVGEPEYHGNPHGNASLVTWRFGYDLPLLATRFTPFRSVEVRRWQCFPSAVIGHMNEVYILRK